MNLVKIYRTLILCGFRKAHSTQHELFKLLQSWQKEIDNHGFVGILLIDLLKSYDCISHDCISHCRIRFVLNN